MRCANECSSNIYRTPEKIKGKSKGEELTPEEQILLRCPDCGERSRPHVLWFDEAYNEKYYRCQSSLEVAGQTELFLIVGTSGTTNLPNQVAWEVKNHDGIIIDVNVEENPFSNLALSCSRGYFIKKQSSVILPQILDIFTKSLSAL